MTERFKFLTTADFMSKVQSADSAYAEGLAKGWQRGYLYAQQDIRRAHAAGYMRPLEIANILYDHGVRKIVQWDGKNGEPPKLDITPWAEIRNAVLLRDGAVCAYCGSTENLHIDHVLPVFRGGSPELENLQVLCRSCNLSRPRR